MSLPKIAVVVPAFKVVNELKNVILSIPESINYIIVVDDKCPYSSGKTVEDLQKGRVFVVYHEKNLGVGGAVITGYRKALELGCDIIIKMDGDGQMDPQYINRFIEPIVKNEADYTKGNRFVDFTTLKSMPRIRLFGNSALSFILKITSGYWNIMDPTNGFTAISKEKLKQLDLSNISKRYFPE